MISTRMCSASTIQCRKKMMMMMRGGGRMSQQAASSAPPRRLPPPQGPSRRFLSSTSTTTKEPPKRPSMPTQPIEKMDPHEMAAELIARNAADRVPGTVAISYLSTEQKMKNFALAGTLLGFCTWVWWYSMNAVGNADNTSMGGGGGGGEQDTSSSKDPLETLRAEAQEARERKLLKKSVTEEEVEELAQLDMGMSDKHNEDDVIVAVAAPDDVAQQEEDLNKAVVVKNSSSSSSSHRRPLWKKIVFFWKKE